MKKSGILMLLCLFIITAGCSAREEKINVIKGAGTANSSLMISFNELCPGTVEGFSDSADKLVVSQRDGQLMNFSLLDIPSKQLTNLVSIASDNSYNFQVSKDGTRFICNDTLYDIKEGKSQHLPTITEGNSNVAGSVFLSSFSFIGMNEPALTNPYYYIRRYGTSNPDMLKQANASANSRVLLVGDIKAKKPDLEISGIASPVLVEEELRYLFLGYKPSSPEPALYSFDLPERKLTLIDNGVKSYSLSPDKTIICYIKTIPGETLSEKLFTVGITGGSKMELASFEALEGMTWSSNGKWIAFSAREQSKTDIHVIRADGSKQERLTQGMSSSGKLAWLGNRIAFSSSQTSDNSTGAKVYSIIINIENPLDAPTVSISPQKRAMHQKLIDGIRSETAKVLKSKENI